MGLFTYDVTLEQVSMPDVDSMPPTPDVRSSWPENDINDSRHPSIAEQRPIQQVGKHLAFITCAYLIHCLRAGDWAGWGEDSMSEIAATHPLLSTSAQVQCCPFSRGAVPCVLPACVQGRQLHCGIDC